MTLDFDDIEKGDIIEFNHGNEIWRGVCREVGTSSIVVEINRALWIGVSSNEVVGVVRGGMT